MTLSALLQEREALDRTLRYLEADDFAYVRGFGPEIDRASRALREVEERIEQQRFN